MTSGGTVTPGNYRPVSSPGRCHGIGRGPGATAGRRSRTAIDATACAVIPGFSLDVAPGPQPVALAACLMSWATAAGWDT